MATCVNKTFVLFCNWYLFHQEITMMLVLFLRFIAIEIQVINENENKSKIKFK